MKKIILLFMIMCLTLVNASEFKKDGQIYQIDDKDYIIRCIEGYKWIQFIYIGVGRGINYFSDGNPQQMFKQESNSVSVPIPCDILEQKNK